MKFFWYQGIFSCIMISKMGVKTNLRIITKNHAADSKKKVPRKIDFRANGTHESHPTALKLIYRIMAKIFINKITFRF